MSSRRCSTAMPLSARRRRSTLGLAGGAEQPSGAAGLPSVVTTGRGLRHRRIPVTSPRPDRVACLACREYARREHLRMAEQAEQAGHLGRVPGSTVSAGQAAQAAERHRDLAGRFPDPVGRRRQSTWLPDEPRRTRVPTEGRHLDSSLQGICSARGVQRILTALRCPPGGVAHRHVSAFARAQPSSPSRCGRL
jgi:hypothetical protein